MMNEIKKLLKENPIIAAVKDNDGLSNAIKCDCKIVFTLYGDICNIGEIVRKIKDSGKLCFVHADLIEGLALKDTAAKFIKQNTDADGIISTKQSVLKAAKELGLMTVHRFFLLDSKSVSVFIKQLPTFDNDCIEVLPGSMPKVTRRIVAASKIPVIAGGLICDKEDAKTALNAGACGISTTNRSVWDL